MTIRKIGRAITGAVLAAVVTIGLSAGPAAAQACSKHEEIVEKLKGKFQEKQLGYGLIGDKAIMEIYASKKGSWTIIVTRSNGISCVVAAGTDWERTIEVAGQAV
ncbi:MAG: hypothetical protein AB3N20_16880 [Rhizobiaceae bacterium]